MKTFVFDALEFDMYAVRSVQPIAKYKAAEDIQKLVILCSNLWP